MMDTYFLRVYGKPEKQNIFVTSLCLAHLFAGLGLLYSWVMDEFSGTPWFIATPTCTLFILTALLFRGRSKAKGVL